MFLRRIGTIARQQAFEDITRKVNTLEKMLLDKNKEIIELQFRVVTLEKQVEQQRESINSVVKKSNTVYGNIV